MIWPAALRIVSLACVIALFVYDYVLGMMAKEVSPYVYLGMIAVALGVDAAWLRDVTMKLILRLAGLDGKDK